MKHLNLMMLLFLISSCTQKQNSDGYDYEDDAGASSYDAPTTSYTQYMLDRFMNNRFDLDTTNQVLRFSEAIYEPLGWSSIDGVTNLLQENANNIDAQSSASKFLKTLDPLNGSDFVLSKEAVSMMFLAEMTNNVDDPNQVLPEIIITLYTHSNTVIYGEWEYLNIDSQDLTYRGTEKIIITNNRWDPNASFVSHAGNIKDAVGRVLWQNDTGNITFIMTFTDQEGQPHEVRSEFGSVHVLRSYFMKMKNNLNTTNFGSYYLPKSY